MKTLKTLCRLAIAVVTILLLINGLVIGAMFVGILLESLIHVLGVTGIGGMFVVIMFVAWILSERKW